MIEWVWAYIGLKLLRGEHMKRRLTAQYVGSLSAEAKAFEVYDTELQGLTLRVQPTGRKTYYLRYRLDSGQRRRMKLGLHGVLKPPTARTLASKVLGEVASGNDPAGQRQTKRADADTLGGFITNVYAPWVISHQKSGQSTVNMIESSFCDLLNKRLVDLSPFLFEKWRKGELDKGATPVAINRYIAAVRGALTKAVEWNHLDGNPLDGIKTLKIEQQTVDRYLDKGEQERLHNAISERNTRMRTERRQANTWRRERSIDLLPDLDALTFVDHLEPMILLSLNTGLRRGELFSLDWRNVDLGSRQLWVTSSSSKSGQVRYLPLNSQTFDVLQSWKRETSGQGLVFKSTNGGRFNNVNTSWRRLLKSGKIEGFRWHDMRHHFASRLVTRGVDLNTVRELMGHSDIKMTLRYAHLAPEHKMRAVEKLVEIVQH